MAITNYSELQTAITNWSHRSDLASIIPDFITIAEKKLFRRLRIRAMESTTTGTVAATVALPAGFVEMISLTVTSGGTTWPLEYTSPNNITTDTGSPTSYSIVGEDLYFLPVGSGESYTLRYYAPLTSVVSTANWLITNSPETYLYAALVELYDYIQEPQLMMQFQGKVEECIATLSVADRNDRYGSGLVVRPA